MCFSSTFALCLLSLYLFRIWLVSILHRHIHAFHKIVIYTHAHTHQLSQKSVCCCRRRRCCGFQCHCHFKHISNICTHTIAERYMSMPCAHPSLAFCHWMRVSVCVHYKWHMFSLLCKKNTKSKRFWVNILDEPSKLEWKWKMHR